MDPSNFLDLYDIVVNELVGDSSIFIALTVIITTFVLIKSKAPTQVYLVTLLIVLAMLSVEWFQLRWILAIFGLGFAGWMFARLRRE